MTPRILAFAGSLRRESFNKKLVPIAAKAARDAGAEVTLIDLKDFPLPLFDQDLEAEQGMPENGKKLKQLFIDHDGLLIASPEYNSSITAVLKNAIDWVSRPAPGEASLVAFRSKVSTLMSASPGALGGDGHELLIEGAPAEAAGEGQNAWLHRSRSCLIRQCPSNFRLYREVSSATQSEE